MINCAIIMGRLTADPELKTTTSGLPVTSFTVAVDRYSKEDEKTDFINVIAWRKTAEFVTRYFHKGSMIAIQGSIQTRNYEDKNGQKRTAVEVVADNVSFCGSKAESGMQPAPQMIQQPAPSFAAAPSFTSVPQTPVTPVPVAPVQYVQTSIAPAPVAPVRIGADGTQYYEDDLPF